MRAPFALLAFALVLAGCAQAPAPAPEAEPVGDIEARPIPSPRAPDEPPAAPPAPPAEGLAPFFPPVVATDGCAPGCFEANVAVDPQGRIYAAGAATGPIARSSDGGATFEQLEGPPSAEGAPTSGVRFGDVLLQVAPDGSLYWSALVVRTQPVFVLEGIQVSRSMDGGTTWAQNVYLGILDDPLKAVVYPDRQWLGFGADGTVYLTYNQIPTGIWSARSDDGGVTWTGWTRAAAMEQRGAGQGQSGPPVVDSKGNVFVPAISMATGTVRVFASEDKGASWRWADVYGAPPRGGSWFPVVAVGPDDRLHAAFYYGGAEILVASSEDAGRTWGEAVVWGGGAVTSPWIVATSADTLAVAFYERDGDSAILRFLRGPVGGEPTSDVVVAEGIKGGKIANTDFAHFAILPDGRAAVVWSTTKDGEAIVAVERAG